MEKGSDGEVADAHAQAVIGLQIGLDTPDEQGSLDTRNSEDEGKTTEVHDGKDVALNIPFLAW